MRKLIIYASIWASIAVPGTVSAQPSVGDTFEAPAETTEEFWIFKGWNHRGGGSHNDDYRFTYFQNENSWMLALTKVLSRRVADGGGAEKIIFVKTLTPTGREQIVDYCALAGDASPLVVFDGKRARGLFIVGNTIRERIWYPKGDECYFDYEH